MSLLNENELLTDASYRSYITSVDKALKHFESTSEWADLISALGKLNKVLLNNVKYPVIPRRITISKRLAQCMHPALPSGVHLKALETYHIIFKCIGLNRLSQELFIYSAGLFHLFGNAAVNVKPSLLSIYETHFVPLGEKLRPGLNGFLSGVLPGLEEGSDYYERTDQLLQQVCVNVEKSFFHGCIWRCVLSNPSIRLPAIKFIINHYDKRLCMEDQLFIIGTDIDTMVHGLCSLLLDCNVLVQRNALDFLLIGFPLHYNQLVSSDMVQVVTSALTVVLRRDMSLNRRLFSWLMGTESVKPDDLKKANSEKTDSEKPDRNLYFKLYSKDHVLNALQVCLNNPQAMGSSSAFNSNADLWCYRLIISLLDRPEISYYILDDVLIDIFRSLYISCNFSKAGDMEREIGGKDKCELKKAANLFFGTLEPAYLWEYSSKHFEIAIQSSKGPSVENGCVQKVGSGSPTLNEMCTLVGFLLEVVSLETFLEAKTEHLPKLLSKIFALLAWNCKTLSMKEICNVLKLGIKLLSNIQPPFINIEKEKVADSNIFWTYENIEYVSQNDIFQCNKSSQQDELHVKSCFKDFKSSETVSSTNGIYSISYCKEKYQDFVATFIKEKIMQDAQQYLLCYRSLILPKGELFEREKRLDAVLKQSLVFKSKCPNFEDLLLFQKDVNYNLEFPNFNQEENVWPDDDLPETFKELSQLLKDLSSFPYFYTNSKWLYEKQLKAGQSSAIPEWLQLLVSLVCFVSSEDLFFNASSALFDLIASSMSVSSNNSSEQSELDTLPFSNSDSSNAVLVSITPAVSMSQLQFLSTETLLFTVAAKKLWKYIGCQESSYCVYAAELLQQIHNLTPENSVCDTIICKGMSSFSESEQVEAQKKFCALWHLSRDLNIKSCSKTSFRLFDRCLFLMLDNLAEETGPLKAISQAWLNHSLQRGDIARILEPILLILLHPDSSRVSVQHVNVHCPQDVIATDSKKAYSTSKVYAISSISGHVIYHKHQNSSFQQLSSTKEERTQTSILNSNSSEDNHILSEQSVQDYKPLANDEKDVTPISLFINPFGSSFSLESDSFATNAIFPSDLVTHTKKLKNGSSFDDDLEDANGLNADFSIENEVNSILDEIICQIVSNETKEIDDIYNDNYQEFIFPEMCVINDLSNKYPGNKNSAQKIIHPLHTYILLYCQVYDSKKTMHALYSLKSIILTNPRLVLCSMASTNISHSLSLRGQQIQLLLARHRKSVFGNDFHGELSAEATTMFRSNTFVEVIVASCLYHIRSYYPNLLDACLEEDEILGCRNVRLLCMEVLTLLFSELVGIAKDSGKSFTSYLSDLLNRGKVQKTLLHCLAASVYNSKIKNDTFNDVNSTFTETIVQFNETLFNQDKCNDFQDTYQIHLLHLVATLIVLEDTVLNLNIVEKESYNSSLLKSGDSLNEKRKKEKMSNTCLSPSKYQPGVTIPCQSMFLSTVLTALKLEHQPHLHIHWLSLVTSALPFVGHWLPRLVMTVVHQLCANLDYITSKLAPFCFQLDVEEKHHCSNLVEMNIPPDYLITIIEGLATLSHYCLLDCPSSVLSPFNQPPVPPVPSQPFAMGTSASQIISNLIHVFSTSAVQQDSSRRDAVHYINDPILAARRVLLSHFPRVFSSLVSTFYIVQEEYKHDNEKYCFLLGTPKVLKQHILGFLSPISLSYGTNLIAAIAVVWQKNQNETEFSTSSVIPIWSKKQLLIVELVAAIKVLPLESIVQIVRIVLKQPPIVSAKIKIPIEVNSLQFFLAYVQQTSGSYLIENWKSLLCLWKDGLQISSVPVQFHLLAILHEFVQKSPLLEDKKSQKDLQDIVYKLIEICSSVACDSLEQKTWLWRHLAVRPGPQSESASAMRDGSIRTEENNVESENISTICSFNNSKYSVQALCCLAEFLAPVLDFVYVGEEKEKVVPLLSNIMYYVTPYLKNHGVHNAPSFHACCQLLANISGYQHTRKAWRKEALDLLLDSTFFQMNSTCLQYWRSIIDHLMTHDKTTFGDFMTRISVAQSGSLNIFGSKEQEFEQRAHFLKRLAFVIFCSETDQYEKYIPEIQEHLTENLKISQSPIVQAHIFLCFRVLLVRMSPHHVTSLWPAIITEMVQIFTQMEYDLCSDSKELSSHLKQMPTIDTLWAVNSSSAHNHPDWLHLYLTVCKLLDMTVALPANVLPQFQIYRWAFIGDSPPLSSEFQSQGELQAKSMEFVPHIKRLSNLLKKKVPSDECLPFSSGKLLLTMPSISSISELQPFFNTLSNLGSQKVIHTSHKCVLMQSNCSKVTSEQIEMILEKDFIEPYVQ